MSGAPLKLPLPAVARDSTRFGVVAVAADAAMFAAPPATVAGAFTVRLPGPGESATIEFVSVTCAAYELAPSAAM